MKAHRVMHCPECFRNVRPNIIAYDLSNPDTILIYQCPHCLEGIGIVETKRFNSML